MKTSYIFPFWTLSRTNLKSAPLSETLPFMIRAKINIPGTGYFFGSSETQSRRAYSSANPILSLRFGVGREKIYIVRANRKKLIVRNRTRRWCSGRLLVCSCDSAVRFLDSENSSQRRLLCLAPRRVHFARPGTEASKPALSNC